MCIQTGTTTELNLADFFRTNNLSYEPVPIETNAEARAAYEADRCDVYTTDASGLAATKATFDDPDAHMVFPEIVSKEPLGPLVRQGDDQWADIARWVLNALIIAEELGVTQGNVERMSMGTDLPEVNRMCQPPCAQGRSIRSSSHRAGGCGSLRAPRIYGFLIVTANYLCGGDGSGGDVGIGERQRSGPAPDARQLPECR